MTQPLRKVVWQRLLKRKTFLPSTLAVTLLGIYPETLKIYVHAKLRTGMFRAASFKMPQVGSDRDVLE